MPVLALSRGPPGTDGELATCAAPGAADTATLGRLGLPPLGLARLFVPALPAHVGQNAGTLYFAPELPESLLQVLALPDMDLQRSVPFWSCLMSAPLDARSIPSL